MSQRPLKPSCLPGFNPVFAPPLAKNGFGGNFAPTKQWLVGGANGPAASQPG